MITHFIAVPQFAADGKLVSSHVTDPLLDPKGPRPGSIQILNQVMQMVMIRHRYVSSLFLRLLKLMLDCVALKK
jgi:hypothetical protein